MLVMRQQQMETFQRQRLAAFETEMVEHCRHFSPRLCEVLGEEQLRLVVRSAIDRAGDWGFTNRGPARLFIEMTFLFGSAMDTDPQYPWIGELLGSDETGFQMQRAQRLYEQTTAYLEQVAGPEDHFTVQALGRIEMLAHAGPAYTERDLVARLLHDTRSVYPQKAAYLGDQALRRLIDEGFEEAAAHGLTAPHDKALLYILMFAFGHGCTRDPLYPWIGQTLAEDKLPDPEARAKRLEKKAMTWLRHAVAALAH